MDTETISIIGIITNAVIGIFGLVIMMYGIHQQQLVTSQNNNSVSKKKGSSATLIGVVIIIRAIIFAINGQSNLTSKSTYPDVAGQYDGSIHNTYLKTTTTLRLFKSIKTKEISTANSYSALIFGEVAHSVELFIAQAISISLSIVMNMASLSHIREL